MATSRTYLLVKDHKTQTQGVVDLVTERWQADGSWVVGERKNGTTTFRHRSFPSLGAVCASFGLSVAAVRKRVLPEVTPAA